MTETAFIYIAALRRTGSTVLSESLTSIPESFIFREPKLGRNKFTVKSDDADLFLRHGIDLQKFSRTWSGNTMVNKLIGRNRILRAFRNDMIPQLLAVVRQIGVKEIHHDGWKFYADAFPNMRVILTARDPRDIFVSTYHRVREGKDHFRRGFSAKELARDLNRDFKQQLAMFEKLPCIKMKYEDLCASAESLEQVKKFVGSDIDGIGKVGQFNAGNPNRVDEASLHGGKITQSRVARWKQESDSDLRREADQIFDRMPEYVDFWSYER